MVWRTLDRAGREGRADRRAAGACGARCRAPDRRRTAPRRRAPAARRCATWVVDAAREAGVAVRRTCACRGLLPGTQPLRAVEEPPVSRRTAACSITDALQIGGVPTPTSGAAPADRRAACRRRSRSPSGGPGPVRAAGRGGARALRGGFERFCRVFPDAFYVSERGRVSSLDDPSDKGRLLSAGFHSMMGYFRDDGPLCELILDDERPARARPPLARVRLHHLVPERLHQDFIFFERAESGTLMRGPSSTSPAPRTRTPPPRRRSSGWPSSTWPRPASNWRERRAPERSRRSRTISRHDPPNIRRVEKARLAAEPSHLDGAARVRRAGLPPAAHRQRSATTCSRFYRSLREKDGLSHEDAVRDTLVSVLMSPHFCYRVDLARRHGVRAAAPAARSEATVAAAVRLRAGQPAELLPLVEHAGRRAARPRRGRRPAPAGGARGPGPADAAATDASAAWPPSSAATGSTSAASRSTTASIASGSRASPTNCGRRCSRSRSASSSTSSAADRSVLDFLYGDAHVRQPGPGRSTTACPSRAAPATSGCASTTPTSYGRGGLLPMAVFLTKNAPGLRTSPVKRGYWVVRRAARRAHPAAAADRARAAQGRGEARRPDAARRCWPATATTRAAPAATSGSTRSAWSSRASARSASAATKDLGGRPVDTARDLPRRQRGHRPRRPARLPARAAPGRLRRQPVPQAASLRPGPQPAALRRSRSSSEMHAPGWTRAATASAPWSRPSSRAHSSGTGGPRLGEGGREAGRRTSPPSARPATRPCSRGRARRGVDEVAAHRLRAEQIGELGEVQQPVRVPGGPVRIVAVHDAVDDVVGLPRLMEELRDARAVEGAHETTMPNRERGAPSCGAPPTSSHAACGTSRSSRDFSVV